MKKLSSIFFVKYLLIGICSLSFVNLNAQTCDENVLKALEQTRATTFENVNVGGIFVILFQVLLTLLQMIKGDPIPCVMWCLKEVQSRFF